MRPGQWVLPGFYWILAVAYVEPWMTQKGSVATEVVQRFPVRVTTFKFVPPDTAPYCGYACGCSVNSRQADEAGMANVFLLAR